MKKQLQSMWSLGILAVLLTAGVSLNAQQTAPPADQPAAQQRQSNQAQDQTQDQSKPQAPDSQAETPPADAQTFTGTIMKSGEKYVFQDAATGNTYDIDHQEQVKQYEGRKVKVRGTLDASTKTIHLR